MKGLAAFWTKAKSDKITIEGRYPVNIETPHDTKAGAIRNGQILVTPGNANIPSNLQVCQGNRLDHSYPTLQAFPKSLRGFAVKPCGETT